MSSPILSVVVCTYNRCESLRDTLKSLGQQVLAPGLFVEIMVVDNNSTDRTKAVVDEAARASLIPFRYVFEAQQGLGYARNRAIREAKGEVICFCDDDQISDPNWVNALWNGFQRFEADAVGGPLLPLWARPPQSWLLDPSLQGHLALLNRGDKPLVAKVGEHSFILGGNSAFRKELFKEVGFFRADLGKTGDVLKLGDDTEFVQRILAVGKKVVYVPEAIMFHKVSLERMQLNYLRRWRYGSGKSYARFSAKQWKGLPPWLIRECAANALKALWNWGRGAVKEAVQSEACFWSQLGMSRELLKRS